MPVSIPGNVISTAGAFDTAFSPSFDARTCSCCNITGTGTALCDCTCCPSGYWTEYTFTISGIENNGCLDCTNWNGTWTLHYQGGCVWQTLETAPNPSCAAFTGGEPMWYLSCSGGVWQLVQPYYEGIIYSNSGISGPPDYCIDGGDLSTGLFDVPGCQSLTGALTTTLVPGGVFVPC